MASEAQMIGYELLKTGALVSFRIVEEEVLSAPDEAEFGLRLQLKFVPDDGDEEQDEDDAAEDTPRLKSKQQPSRSCTPSSSWSTPFGKGTGAAQDCLPC